MFKSAKRQLDCVISEMGKRSLVDVEPSIDRIIFSLDSIFCECLTIEKRRLHNSDYGVVQSACKKFGNVKNK